MTLKELIILAKKGHVFKAKRGKFTYAESTFRNAEYWSQKEILADWKIVEKNTTSTISIANEFFDELFHFFVADSGGWPLALSEERAKKLMNALPLFYINNQGRLAVKKGAKLNPGILKEIKEQ